MNHKNPVAAASVTLAAVGWLGLASASGCSSAPDVPIDSPDAAHFADASASVDSATPDAGNGTSLEAGSCAPDTADCDGDPRNGCEVKVSADPKNCGVCKHDCTGLPHVSGATTCEAGKCVVPASSCATGYAHCSSNVDDGCEADLTKPATCGTCTTSCSGATPVCASGSCSSGCPSSAPTQCSGSCVDTTQSATNCGSCSHACTSPAHGQATCASSTCGFACNSGYHACGAGCADNTSAQTCGSSCTPCSAPANGVATCDGASCGFACNIGFHACGATCVSDSDATACGASCTVCSVPGGAGHATCASNMCGVSCDSGNHLCGTSCASNTDTATCGTSCTPCAAPPGNGHAACDGTSCSIACDATFHQCGGNCDSNTSTASCGSSCTPCAAPPSNGQATCDGTSCGIACDASYHQCGGLCDSNNSVLSCGTSCTPCATPPNAQPTCNGVSCAYTCNAGYADCDGNAANGCEVNLTSDSAHCGTCARTCFGGTCGSSTCQPAVLASASGLGPIAVKGDTVYYGAGATVLAVKTDRTLVGSFSLAASALTVTTGPSVGYVLITASNGDVWSTFGNLTNQVKLGGDSTQYPSSSTILGAQAYWANANGVVNQIWSASLLGSPANVPFTDAPPSNFLHTPKLAALRSDSHGFVWALADLSTSVIRIAPTDLSSAVSVAQSGVITDIALDANSIWWVANGELWHSHRDGSGTLEMIGATNVKHVAADASGVYFTFGGTVWSASPTFQMPSGIASGTDPTSIATGSNFIVWNDPSAGKVMILAK